MSLAGTTGPASWTVFTIAIFAAQVVATAVWLRHLRYRLVEWLCRRLTYSPAGEREMSVA